MKEKKAPKFHNILTTPENSIAIYTVLSILRKMKNELSLEAMIEYIDQYLLVVERHNPKVKQAVHKALSLMSVQEMYRKACS